MAKISLVHDWNLKIRGVEREPYLLRLEEADIQKMDQTCRPGSATPSLQLLQSRAGIAKNADELMDLRSCLVEIETIDNLPHQAFRRSSYARAKKNLGNNHFG
jgi:hypothetical protein